MRASRKTLIKEKYRLWWEYLARSRNYQDFVKGFETLHSYNMSLLFDDQRILKTIIMTIQAHANRKEKVSRNLRFFWTYTIVGNISETSFEKWWEQMGSKLSAIKEADVAEYSKSRYGFAKDIAEAFLTLAEQKCDHDPSYIDTGKKYQRIKVIKPALLDQNSLLSSELSFETDIKTNTDTLNNHKIGMRPRNFSHLDWYIQPNQILFESESEKIEAILSFLKHFYKSMESNCVLWVDLASPKTNSELAEEVKAIIKKKRKSISENVQMLMGSRPFLTGNFYRDQLERYLVVYDNHKEGKTWREIAAKVCPKTKFSAELRRQLRDELKKAEILIKNAEICSFPGSYQINRKS